MNKTYSRRNVLKNLAGSAALLSTGVLLPGAVRAELEKEQLKEELNVAEVEGKCQPLGVQMVLSRHSAG